MALIPIGVDYESEEFIRRYLSPQKRDFAKAITHERRKQRNEARKLRPLVFQIYGHLCFYCNLEFATTIDHVIPLSKGGTNDIENLRPACFRCNCKKGDKISWQYDNQRQ